MWTTKAGKYKNVLRLSEFEHDAEDSFNNIDGKKKITNEFKQFYVAFLGTCLSYDYRGNKQFKSTFF